MKSQYVEELKPGQSVKERFLLTKKTIKEKKDGGYYTVVEFSDRTGTIEGIAWDSASESLKQLAAGDFTFVIGNVNEYNERLQVVVSAISRASDDEIDPEDFLPKSEEDIDKVLQEIGNAWKKIQHSHLRNLLELFFNDPAFIKKFRTAPAAKMAHHAYIGGLAVHTRNVLRLVTEMHKAYSSLNLEMLTAAALLHDIGKIREYGYQKKIDITTRGRMLGHILLGYEMVTEKMDQLARFPDDLRVKLLHMIVSHHGELAWGSPKRPLFPEALVLHFADNLDSKIEMMMEVSRKSRGNEREWSDYHPLLEREIYLGEDL